MKSLYVGQWMVISILSQLWANLRMFGCLWKKARVNIVLPCAHSAARLSCFAGWFRLLCCLWLAATLPQIFRDSPKVSVWIQQQHITCGQTDMSSVHSSMLHVCSTARSPQGWLSAGLSFCNFAVQPNVPRIHHSVLPMKPTCCQSSGSTWPADRHILWVHVWNIKIKNTH